VNDAYRIEVWKRDYYTRPVTVVLPGRIGKEDAAQRFQQIGDSVTTGRANGEQLTYITWADVIHRNGGDRHGRNRAERS
jgi:hypothetical protein